MKTIFDIGMHDGKDALFYLQKGFRVVGIDAHPGLMQKCAVELKSYIDSGLLDLWPVGVGEKEEKLSLYIHKSNPDWTRFDRDADGRFPEGSYETVVVDVVPFSDIYKKYETPYYIKLDIEGGELAVIRQIIGSGRLPAYISFEANQDIQVILNELAHAGYRQFSVINQLNNPDIVMPTPPLEGNYVQPQFDWHMSGPFGREVLSPWWDGLDKVLQFFADHRAKADAGDETAQKSWFDIHARL